MKIKVVVVDLQLPPLVQRWGLRVGVMLAIGLGASVVAYGSSSPPHFEANMVLTAAALNSSFGNLDDRISTLESNGTPAGAVLAFNLSACPPGWTAFADAAGRAIVGTNAVATSGISLRKLGDLVGEETHVMSVSELPAHTHDIYLYEPGSTADNQGVWNKKSWDVVGGQADRPARLGGGFQNFMADQPTGENAPFNNMQPSLALLYCVKK
jgi:hypothetical protein